MLILMNVLNVDWWISWITDSKQCSGNRETRTVHRLMANVPWMSVPLQRQKPRTTWTRYITLDKNKNNHFMCAFYYLFILFNNLLSIHIHKCREKFGGGLSPPSPWWAPPMIMVQNILHGCKRPAWLHLQLTPCCKGLLRATAGKLPYWSRNNLATLSVSPIVLPKAI